jgi:hypothetical protein
VIILSLDNLPNEINEQEVEKHFSCYGKIKSIKLTLGAQHSRRCGSGFIEMDGNAQNIISALDGCLLWGKFLRITEVHSTEKTQRNLPGYSVASNQPTADITGDHIHQLFHIASIEKVTDQEFGPEKDWCRYTLISGNSRITGLHRGTIAEVTEYAVNSVEAFNLRNNSKSGRSFTWPTSRNKM